MYKKFCTTQPLLLVFARKCKTARFSFVAKPSKEGGVRHNFEELQCSFVCVFLAQLAKCYNAKEGDSDTRALRFPVFSRITAA